MIEVELKGLVVDTGKPVPGPVILLAEKKGIRILPIWIGPCEATSISYAFNKEYSPRPFTIDFIERMLRILDGEVQRVLINKIVDGVFYSTVVIKQGANILTMDARPSDAVGLAIRVNAPIYVAEEIMEDTEIVLEGKLQISDELIEEMKILQPEDIGDVQWKR